MTGKGISLVPPAGRSENRLSKYSMGSNGSNRDNTPREKTGSSLPRPD